MHESHRDGVRFLRICLSQPRPELPIVRAPARADDFRVWDTSDPNGRIVELSLDRWSHISEGHPELRVTRRRSSRSSRSPTDTSGDVGPARSGSTAATSDRVRGYVSSYPTNAIAVGSSPRFLGGPFHERDDRRHRVQ